MAKSKQQLIDVIVGKLKLKSSFAARNKTRINRAIDSSIENFQEQLENLEDTTIETLMSLGENSEKDMLSNSLEKYLLVENQKRDINNAIIDLQNLKTKLTQEVEIEEEK